MGSEVNDLGQSEDIFKGFDGNHKTSVKLPTEVNLECLEYTQYCRNAVWCRVLPSVIGFVLIETAAVKCHSVLLN